MFKNRDTYRRVHQPKEGQVSFEITVKETNLSIRADQDLTDQAIRSTLKYRQFIETHILQHPNFAASLTPLPDPGPSPEIITEMIGAAQIAGVGPMAAVAGAMAEYVGRDLLEWSKQIMVENGGDIFIKSDTQTIFTIYAGDSPFNMKTGICVAAQERPFALCTSSGTLGHSKSFGTADAVCVLADSCILADAAATALGNRIKTVEDIEIAIQAGQEMKGIRGLVMIKGKQIGLWGELKLVRL